MELDNSSPAAAFVMVSIVVTLISLALAFAMDPFALGVWPWHVTQVPVTSLWCMLVQWIAFVPAAIYDTEKFYDLTGSVTYVSAIVAGLVYAGTYTARQIMVSSMVLVWAIRLGSFLFARISADGKDGRFDELRVRPVRFFNVWTIQGLWVFLTAAPAFCLNAAGEDVNNPPLGVTDLLGAAVWAFGFSIEVIADNQKSAWRANPENAGKFIRGGVWSLSRHPNYFGEITLWCGVLLACCRVFVTPGRHGMWVSAISPLFVAALICRVSGIPLLEKRADEKWGDDPEYVRYKAETPVLMLRLPCCGPRPSASAGGGADDAPAAAGAAADPAATPGIAADKAEPLV